MKAPADSQQLMKHNNIIRASYKLNLSEIRLLALVVRTLQPSKLNYEIHASEYSTAYGVDIKTAYGALIEASENLFDRRFTAYTDKSKKLMHWVQTIEYFNEKGKVGVKIAEDFMGYLIQLKENFTVLDFNELSKLKSAYSVRIFEVLKSYQYLNTVVLSLDDIRRYFDLKKDYSQNNIQEKILKPALSQIDAVTSLEVTYEPIKEGRRIVGYRFDIKTKTKKAVKKEKKPALAAVEFSSRLEIELFKQLQQVRPAITQEEVLKQAKLEGVSVISMLEFLKRQQELL